MRWSSTCQSRSSESDRRIQREFTTGNGREFHYGEGSPVFCRKLGDGWVVVWLLEEARWMVSSLSVTRSRKQRKKKLPESNIHNRTRVFINSCEVALHNISKVVLLALNVALETGPEGKASG